MTNKEKYKQAFSVLHTSGNLSMEVEKMSYLKKKHRKYIAAAAAICVLLAGGTGTAYAANLGGIQRTVQIWMHGDQTDAVLEINSDVSYTISYEDEDGNTVEQHGGGMAMDGFGNERSLTEDEIVYVTNAPYVEYEEDGSVWVYYYDQKTEITDKFDEDGICYVSLVNGDETLYMTIKYDDGWCVSSSCYENPASFN